MGRSAQASEAWNRHRRLVIASTVTVAVVAVLVNHRARRRRGRVAIMTVVRSVLRFVLAALAEIGTTSAPACA